MKFLIGSSILTDEFFNSKLVDSSSLTDDVFNRKFYEKLEFDQLNCLTTRVQLMDFLI